MTPMLTLQRRHSPKCPHRSKGPFHLKCNCLLRARASKRLSELDTSEPARPRKRVLEAVKAFEARHDSNSLETKRRYKRLLRYFTEFRASESLAYVDDITAEAGDRYEILRGHPKSWVKDVELLTQFFEFCRHTPGNRENHRSLRRYRTYKLRASASPGNDFAHALYRFED